MPIFADTGAVVYSGATFLIDDPARALPGFPATNAILQSRKVNFTLTNLGTTTKLYTSGYKADIIALAQFYANYGATIDIEEGPVYKISVNLPYDEFAYLDEDPTKYALWEVIPNAVERDIFEVGIYSPSVQNGPISTTRLVVNNTIKGAIQQAYKNPMMTVNLTVKPEWSSAQYLAENYLALKRLGADSVQGFTQTLKRTLIINTLTNEAYDPISEGYPSRVNPLIAADDLTTLYSVPDNIQVHMLPSYSRQRTVTGQDGVTLVGLAGYLVKKPTYQQVTPNKIQLTQEFVWDEWLDSLYQPYNGDYTAFPPID
jgi:hypothetical protein